MEWYYSYGTGPSMLQICVLPDSFVTGTVFPSESVGANM